jgi:hypothetical protein
MSEKMWFAAKKIFRFGIFVTIIYLLWELGMYLFPGTIGQGTQEAGADIQSFWIAIYDSIVGSLKEAVKQIFMNIHQTLVLLFVGWLFTGIRSLWIQMKDRVGKLLDVLLFKMSQEQRDKIKAHLDAIVLANIELVESAFALVGGGENEDVEAKRARNEEKLSAALTMVLYDLMKDNAGRQLVSEYSKEELVRMLICEIEKTLHRQKVVADVQETVGVWEGKIPEAATMFAAAKVSPFFMGTMSGVDSLKMNEIAANRLKNIVNLAQGSLSKDLLDTMQTELARK